MDLTVQALMQLDRRLSVARRQKGKQRAGDSDEDFESPAARLTAVAESSNQALEELPVYCFQHSKQTLEQQGIFVGSKYVHFQGEYTPQSLAKVFTDGLGGLVDWIPPDLPQETKLQLRHEMSKPFSPDDPIGYIYVHEMASKGKKTAGQRRMGLTFL